MAALCTDSCRVAERHGRRSVTDGRRQLAGVAPAERIARADVKGVRAARHEPDAHQQPAAGHARHAAVWPGGGRAAGARVALDAEEGDVVEDGVLKDGVVVCH